jgi:hypothetical protein
MCLTRGVDHEAELMKELVMLSRISSRRRRKVTSVQPKGHDETSTNTWKA